MTGPDVLVAGIYAAMFTVYGALVLRHVRGARSAAPPEDRTVGAPSVL